MGIDIDWSKVLPSHPVCEEPVLVPTIRVQQQGLGYAKHLVKPNAPNEIVVQWFGDNKGEELRERNFQFNFLVLADPLDIQFMGHPEWFRVVMLGSLKNWPNPAAIPQIMDQIKCTEKEIVAYLITSQICRDDGKGENRPTAILVKVACLGDGNFGVIAPRLYLDMTVSEEEVNKAKVTRALP